MTHSINDITSNIGPSPNRQQEKDLAESMKSTNGKTNILQKTHFYFIF